MHTYVQTPCFTSSTFLNCVLPEWLSDTQHLALLAGDMGLLRVVVQLVKQVYCLSMATSSTQPEQELPARERCDLPDFPQPGLSIPYRRSHTTLRNADTPATIPSRPPQTLLVRRDGEKSGGRTVTLAYCSRVGCVTR